VQPIDRIRIGLKLADYYDHHHQPERAQAERDLMLRLFPIEAVRFGITPPNNAAPSATTSAQPTLPVPPKPPEPPKPQ